MPAPQSHDTTARRGDGTTFPVRLSLRVLATEGGQSVVAIVKDLSEVKHLETRLQEAQRMEAVGLLAGGVAHDFNNLLMVVNNNLHLLSRLVPQTAGSPQIAAIDRGPRSASIEARACHAADQRLATDWRVGLPPIVADLMSQAAERVANGTAPLTASLSA
mgnify:CR=1 FL=1